MANIEGLKAMRIGCDSVVWAPLELDDNTKKPTYQTKTDGEPVVFALPGVMALNINPNMSIETAFYDDGPGEVATSLGNIEVTFNKSALSHEERAMLLGKVKSKAGILFHSKTDIAPWGALGFRTLRSDGSYRYVWLYKGKFTEPVDNNETKADSINFQSDELVGRFVKLGWEFTVANDLLPTDKNVGVRPWKIEVESVDYGGEALKSLWMNKVLLPDEDLFPSDIDKTKAYMLISTIGSDKLEYIQCAAQGDITIGVKAGGGYEFPTTSIATYCTWEKGKWTTTVPTAAVEVIGATKLIMHNSEMVKQNSTLLLAANPIPGITGKPVVI